MVGPLFWQLALRVDPYGKRLPELYSALEAAELFDPMGALRTHPKLTERDRGLLAKTDSRKLEQVLNQGAWCRSCKDLNLPWREWGIPPAFFGRGAIPQPDQPRVSIVGTRTASTYGKAAALKFGQHLASAGVQVVSGGAFGIDASAHRGALDAGGSTMAILGTGIENLQPAANSSLFQEIIAKGTILSQYAVGSPGKGDAFIARNHTIAALSHAVVVIEAPERSGALHTARAAAELGREVFVVPGPITLENFRGSHALIRDGATLVDHPSQILEQLGIQDIGSGFISTEDVSEIGGQITEALKDGPQMVEILAETLGLDPGELMAELTMLEVEGLVVRVPEGYALQQ